MTSDETGVVVPADASGRRSSSALGRAVVADALRSVDPVGATGAERETNWRSGYLVHMRRLVEAGVTSRHAAVTVATDGLQSVHRQMQYQRTDGDDQPLDAAPSDTPSRPLSTVEIAGTGQPEETFSLPLRGQRLSGDALARQLDTWAELGVLEPSAV